jgi:hypothetical protein
MLPPFIHGGTDFAAQRFQHRTLVPVDEEFQLWDSQNEIINLKSPNQGALNGFMKNTFSSQRYENFRLKRY